MAERDTGGSAFPEVRSVDGDDDISAVRHSEDGWRSTYIKSFGGMTLRDYFAGQALFGQIAAFADERARQMSVDNASDRGVTPKQQVAFAAYEYADAMLKARETE